MSNVGYSRIQHRGPAGLGRQDRPTRHEVAQLIGLSHEKVDRGDGCSIAVIGLECVRESPCVPGQRTTVQRRHNESWFPRTRKQSRDGVQPVVRRGYRQRHGGIE